MTTGERGAFGLNALRDRSSRGLADEWSYPASRIIRGPLGLVALNPRIEHPWVISHGIRDTI